MSNSSYSNDSNDNTQEQQSNYEIVDVNTNYDDDDTLWEPPKPVTASSTSLPADFPEEKDMEGPTVMGIGLIEAYECNAADPIGEDGPDTDDLNELLDLVWNPGRPQHPGGWDKNQVMDQGKDLNIDKNGELVPQFDFTPCINYPYDSGWDYVDYTPRAPGASMALGQGVQRVLTLPFGPPKGYGNKSHNPINYEQTSGWVKIRYHMDGIKWHHVKKERYWHAGRHW